MSERDSLDTFDPTLHRIDGTRTKGAMVSIHVDGWITACRGHLTVNGRSIVKSTGRYDLTAPGHSGVRVQKHDIVKCEWFGDKPPSIEWSER